MAPLRNQLFPDFLHVMMGNPMACLSGIILFRGQKINANVFCTKFFDNPSGHGCPRRKSWTSAPKSAFSCGPSGGEKLLTPGRPGVRVRNIRGQSGPKSLCLCCFFSLLVTHGIAAPGPGECPAMKRYAKDFLRIMFSVMLTKE